MKPTPEQEAIVDAFRTGRHLAVEAGAGTGKTSTQVMISDSAPNRYGAYLAYNRSLKVDAEAKFPRNVTCKTVHSYAYHAVKAWRFKSRMDADRIRADAASRILGINDPYVVDKDRKLRTSKQAYFVMEACKRFSMSADIEPSWHHFPVVPGLDEPDPDRKGRGPANRALAQALEPYLLKAWQDMCDPEGRLNFDQDCYVKQWHLTDHQIGASYILFDEAQDSWPTATAIVLDQADSQLIVVGDSNQQINGWRGAVNAMANFPGERLYLSQSFRFGQAIADEANRWLSQLPTQLRLTGTDRIDSVVRECRSARAVLCRTNGGVLAEAVHGRGLGKRVHMVGRVGPEIAAFARAAISLQNGREVEHRDLAGFTSWSQVQEFAKTDEGADISMFVDLIEKYGAKSILDIVDSCVPEDRADLIVSTAHQSKGREWDSVRIGADFERRKIDADTGLSNEEIMLRYVAVTRAREVLDLGPLSTGYDQPGEDEIRAARAELWGAA